MIFVILSCQQAELRKINKAYLWPQSNVWMRVRKRAFKTPRLKSQICFFIFLSSSVSASPNPSSKTHIRNNSADTDGIPQTAQ